MTMFATLTTILVIAAGPFDDAAACERAKADVPAALIVRWHCHTLPSPHAPQTAPKPVAKPRRKS